MNPFKAFTDEQLIEELLRRRNDARTKAPPDRWCEDCAHFTTWSEEERKGPMPEDFNPCTKGHKMQFQMPDDDYLFDAPYGFFRRICVDRTPIA